MAGASSSTINPAIENLVYVAMHSDGRQIAFTVEQSGSELWIMENFHLTTSISGISLEHKTTGNNRYNMSPIDLHYRRIGRFPSKTVAN